VHAAHELFAQHLADNLPATVAAERAGLNPTSAGHIRLRHGIEARVAVLLGEKARAMPSVPDFSRSLRKSILAGIALDKKSSRREKMQAVVLYENLYGDEEQGASETLSLAEFVGLYGRGGERPEVKTIECEVIEHGR